MFKELLINVLPTQTRIAYLEQGVVQEIEIESKIAPSIVGNLYKGKVVRILPGLQAAFVDIGLQKNAFLHLSDIASQTKDNRSSQAAQQPVVISQLLHTGQNLLVQVIKDPLGEKGAKITTSLALPSRYFVLVPARRQFTFSRRIKDAKEIKRLTTFFAQQLSETVPLVIRTSAQGVDEQELRRDADWLQQRWDTLQTNYKSAVIGAVLYTEVSLSKRYLRDFDRFDLSRILVDSPQEFAEVKAFLQQIAPYFAEKLELYSDFMALFELYGIEKELKKALERKVMLPSGGYLVIDQNEAMVTIDVNTGAFTGQKSFTDTIYRLNLEAATVIGQQIKLRNLGGIIIIDFIDMQEKQHQQAILSALKNIVVNDRATTIVHGISKLGLVEISRKRTRENLAQILGEECHHCCGSGKIRKLDTLYDEIVQALITTNQKYHPAELILYTSPALSKVLLTAEERNLQALGCYIGKPVKINVQSNYRQDQFDIVIA